MYPEKVYAIEYNKMVKNTLTLNIKKKNSNIYINILK